MGCAAHLRMRKVQLNRIALSEKGVAPGLFSPVEAATIHEGLISSKRRLICLNMCVVRLVCLEQRWTVSVAWFYAPSSHGSPD